MIGLVAAGLMLVGQAGAPAVRFDVLAQQTQTKIQLLKVGEKAPDFKLKSSIGQMTSLADARMDMKATLIAFWSQEMPKAKINMLTLKELYLDATDRGLQVLAVNVKDQPKSINQFAQENEIEFTMLLNGEGKDDVARKYKATQVPVIYILGPDGKIAASFQKFDWPAIVKELNKLGL